MNGTALSGFPMLVSSTLSDLAASSSGGYVQNPNGYDIVFAADASGTIPLAFETESYNSTNGALIDWVNVPTLSWASNAIYMFYDKAGVNSSQASTTQVWGNGYAGVWHLPNGTTLGLNDSTANGNNGANNGAVAATGVVNGGASFSASSTDINLGTNASLRPTGSFTVSAWIKAATTQLAFPMVLTDGGTTGQTGYNLYIWNNAGFGEAGLIVKDNSGWGTAWAHGLTNLQDASWHSLTGVYTNNTAVSMYVDGSFVASTTSNGPMNYGTSPVGMIGWKGDSGVNDTYSGLIDEGRVSNVARSDDWIKTEYYNQSNPGNFYTITSNNPAPGISSLSPSFTPSGGSQFTLTVNGGNFMAGSVVNWNGSARSTTYVSPTQLTATITAADIASSGITSVTVVNPAPGGGVSGLSFTVTNFSGYAHQRAITINHAYVVTNFGTNFPVLISGTYSWLAATSSGGYAQSPNGYDIIFTSDSSCATKLNWETESYSASTGAVNYWVQIPSLSSSVDTVIYASSTQSNFPMLVSSTLASWEPVGAGRIQHLCTAPNGGRSPATLSSQPQPHARCL